MSLDDTRPVDQPVGPQWSQGFEQAGPEDPSSVWRAKYQQARRRAQVLAATTAVASVAAVGGVAWGISESNDAAEATAAAAELTGFPEGVPDGLAPGGGFGGPGGGPGGAGRGGALEQLLTEDGSVDTDAVEEFLASIPDGFDPSFLIERGIARGVLTQAQAEELLDAFESASITGSNTAEAV